MFEEFRVLPYVQDVNQKRKKGALNVFIKIAQALF